MCVFSVVDLWMRMFLLHGVMPSSQSCVRMLKSCKPWSTSSSCRWEITKSTRDTHKILFTAKKIIHSASVVKHIWAAGLRFDRICLSLSLFIIMDQVAMAVWVVTALTSTTSVWRHPATVTETSGRTRTENQYVWKCMKYWQMNVGFTGPYDESFVL